MSAPVEDGPAAYPGGGAPHHLAVVPRLVVEPVARHAGHRELVDLREPGVYRLPPVGADLPGVEGLVQVLSHLEPLHAAALRAVVSVVKGSIRTSCLAFVSNIQSCIGFHNHGEYPYPYTRLKYEIACRLDCDLYF